MSHFKEALNLLKQLVAYYNDINVEEIEKYVNDDVYKIEHFTGDISIVKTCNIFKCKEILTKLKMIIIHLPSVNPLMPIWQKNKEELILVREILEKGVIISIRDKDIKSFNIYISQLFTYYFDYKDILKKSKKQNGIIGIYLLYLLASNLIGDFHMTLETISIDDQSDKYIKYVLELEQHIMDGYFNCVLNRKEEIPLYLYSLFMEKLHETIRYKLADCIYSSSNSISTNHACQLFKFNSYSELYEFVTSYNETKTAQGESNLVWKLQDNKITFNNQHNVTQELPSLDIFNNTIRYATELERII